MFSLLQTVYSVYAWHHNDFKNKQTKNDILIIDRGICEYGKWLATVRLFYIYAIMNGGFNFCGDGDGWSFNLCRVAVYGNWAKLKRGIGYVFCKLCEETSSS